MLNLLNRLKTKAINNLKGVIFENILIVIVLSIFVLLLAGNIYRVFSNGWTNYSTFISEKEDRDKLLAKNGKLKEEFVYVTSDEYKQLLLRDSQRLALENENLYRTTELPKYFEEEPEYLDLRTKKQYGDWWGALIR